MVAISQGAGIALINTFTVAPERVDELLAVLEKATDEVMRHVPGFVSANFHRSLDGRHVANYAQWESKDAFDAMLRDEKAREHMGRCIEIAEGYEPILYEVVSVHSRT